MSTKTFQPGTLLIFVNYAWDYRQYLFSVLLQIFSVSHESDFTWWKRKYLWEILLPKAKKKILHGNFKRFGFRQQGTIFK